MRLHKNHDWVHDNYRSQSRKKFGTPKCDSNRQLKYKSPMEVSKNKGHGNLTQTKTPTNNKKKLKTPNKGEEIEDTHKGVFIQRKKKHNNKKTSTEN